MGTGFNWWPFSATTCSDWFYNPIMCCRFSISKDAVLLFSVRFALLS